MRVDAARALLLALPWALLALEPGWVFSRLNMNVDPWIYFGYFVNPPHHFKAFDGLYFGSRLSLILPGRLAYHVLPPLAANLALHLGVYYLAVFSTYEILARTACRRAALLAALALGTNHYFLDAAGRDYADGPGSAYYLAAALFITLAAGSRSRAPLLAASGASAAALIVANLFYVVFLPPLVVHYLVTTRGRDRAARLAGGLAVGLGFAALMLAFSAYYHGATGSYRFLASSFEFLATHRHRRGANPYKVYTAGWVASAGHLTALLAALAAVSISARRPAPPGLADPRACAAFGWVFVVLAVFYLAFETLLDGAILQIPFYASMLLPPAYLALGPVIARPLAGLDRGRYAAVAAFAAASLLVPYAVPEAVPASGGRVPPALLAASLPALAAALALARGKAGVRSCALAFAGLGLSSALAMPRMDREVNRLFREDDPLAARYRAYDRDRRSVYLAIYEGARALDEIDRADGATAWYDKNVWFTPGDPHAVLLLHLSFAYAPARVYVAGFDEVTVSGLRPGLRFALLSSEPGAAGRVRRALRGAGFDALTRANRQVAAGEISFYATIIQVTEAGEGRVGGRPGP